MKNMLYILFFNLPIFTFAQLLVQQLPLDEKNVYQIEISQSAPTTIMFPGKITSISSANVTISDDMDAPIMLSYKEGMYFFNVRALKSEARGAINVVYKNKTYVFSMHEGINGMRSVTMYEKNINSQNAFRNSMENPLSLLKMLDKAKTYEFFKERYPSAVQQIETKCPNSSTLYKDFEVVLEEVFKFDLEDTLVFRIKFKNNSAKDIYYQPQQLAARVGDNVYYASIADASGIIPANFESNAYFAITGRPGGGKANLSVHNLFNIIVMRVEDVSVIIPSKC